MASAEGPNEGNREGPNEGTSESTADRGKRIEERRETPTADSAVASNERKEAPAGNRTPAAVSTMGGDVSRMMAGAVGTNIQTASNVISTVQVVNQIQGAINTNTLVTPTSTARTQQMHSLMIRFRAPSP